MYILYTHTHTYMNLSCVNITTRLLVLAVIPASHTVRSQYSNSTSLCVAISLLIYIFFLSKHSGYEIF